MVVMIVLPIRQVETDTGIDFMSVVMALLLRNRTVNISQLKSYVTVT